VAHQGDNVTLVCTARPVDFIDVVRLTLSPSFDHHVVAALGPPRVRESAPPRWTIADNDVVKSPFVALPRYGVKMTVDGRRAVVRLRLTGEEHLPGRLSLPTPRHAGSIISPMSPTHSQPGSF